MAQSFSLLLHFCLEICCLAALVICYPYYFLCLSVSLFVFAVEFCFGAIFKCFLPQVIRMVREFVAAKSEGIAFYLALLLPSVKVECLLPAKHQ